MYCSACSSPISEKLNYCKNCGAKIVKDEETTPQSMLDNLLTRLTFIALGGLGILIGLVAVLLKNGVPHGGVATIAIFYLAVLFGICYMILNQVPKLIEAKLKKSENNESIQPVQVSAPITAQLEEYREPVSSVTENTTRTFDKSPRTES